MTSPRNIQKLRRSSWADGLSIPRKSNDQTLPIGRIGNPLHGFNLILKTILCLVLDFHGFLRGPYWPSLSTAEREGVVWRFRRIHRTIKQSRFGLFLFGTFPSLPYTCWGLAFGVGFWGPITSSQGVWKPRVFANIKKAHLRGWFSAKLLIAVPRKDSIDSFPFAWFCTQNHKVDLIWSEDNGVTIAQMLNVWCIYLHLPPKLPKWIP